MSKQITCKLCGFITHEAMDMIEHLAQSLCDGRLPEENCGKKILILDEVKNEKKN